MDFQSIVNIILGSGLIAFVITEIVRCIGRAKAKNRVIKEIAFELLLNEYAAKFIVEDFQILQKDPCGYLRRHKFSTQIIDSVISSGYFVNLDNELFQFIAEFAHRFRNIQTELEGHFQLEDNEKLRNIVYLPIHERNASVLLNDLQESEVFKKLKKKYRAEWKETRLKFIHERSSKEKSIKEGES